TIGQGDRETDAEGGAQIESRRVEAGDRAEMLGKATLGDAGQQDVPQGDARADKDRAAETPERGPLARAGAEKAADAKEQEAQSQGAGIPEAASDPGGPESRKAEEDQGD